MKVILAIETSTTHGSVAVVCGDEVRFEIAFRAERSHNSLIFGPLKDALAAGRPDLIAVGTGPGSHSGIRVGLAAAVGLGFALDAPVAGWPSLTAFPAPPRCQVVGDARRGLVFIADIHDGRLTGPPAVVAPEQAAEMVNGPVFTFDNNFPSPLLEATHTTPSACWLARRAATLTGTEIAALATRAPEPLYLHLPFVTTPRTQTAG